MSRIYCFFLGWATCWNFLLDCYQKTQTRIVSLPDRYKKLWYSLLVWWKHGQNNDSIHCTCIQRHTVDISNTKPHSVWNVFYTAAWQTTLQYIKPVKSSPFNCFLQFSHDVPQFHSTNTYVTNQKNKSKATRTEKTSVILPTSKLIVCTRDTKSTAITDIWPCPQCCSTMRHWITFYVHCPCLADYGQTKTHPQTGTS